MFSLATKFASFISAILRQASRCTYFGSAFIPRALIVVMHQLNFYSTFFPFFFFHDSSQTKGKKRKTQNAFGISKHPPFCGGKVLLDNLPSR